MLVATGAMVITGHSSAQPYKSFADLLAASKAKPGLPQYGTIGSGSLAHLAITQMGAQAGFTGTHVPYKGGGPLAQDAYAGHVPIAIGSIALLAPHIRSGALWTGPNGSRSTRPTSAPRSAATSGATSSAARTG